MSAGFRELLRNRLAGIAELSEPQVAALEAHYHLLMKWNRVLSLTTITKLDEAVERHYCESIFLGVHLPPGEWSIADVGSGAGFPGFPIAVIRPECRVTLIESHQRKAVFLREATRGMSNVWVLGCRAESIEERFDWVVSRAVSGEDLSPVLEKLGGRAALLTGAEQIGGGSESLQLPWGKQRFLRMIR